MAVPGIPSGEHVGHSLDRAGEEKGRKELTAYQELGLDSGLRASL